jgi:hypothetical protein
MTARRKTTQARPDSPDTSNSPGELVPRETPFRPPTPKEQTALVVKTMAQQHPIYGAFGLVFEEIGGVEALADWAADNPTDFYRIFSRMVPQDAGTGGQINIQINNQLGPSPLDS